MLLVWFFTEPTYRPVMAESDRPAAEGLKGPGEGGPDSNRPDLNRPDLKECFLT
jgi:hypothetical protein